MSKNYIVNCYACQHNGQETCKGCNTILNGDNEPYENWQLREDLEQKDKEIEELQEQFEVTEQLRQEALNEGLKVVESDINRIEELQEQLEEKNKELSILKENLKINSPTAYYLIVNDYQKMQFLSQVKSTVKKIRKNFGSRLKKALWEEEYSINKVADMVNEVLDETLKECEE